MKNKKALILLLAIIAIVAIALSGCSKKTEEAVQKVEEGAAVVEEAAEKASETAVEAADQAAEKTEESAAVVEEAAQAATEEAAAAAQEVTEKAEEAAAEVTEKAEEAAAAVEETAAEVTEKAEEAAAAVEETAAEVTEKAEEAAAAVEETAAEAAEEAKVMSYEDFVNAELDTDVCVEAYVQASQAWWAKDGVGRMTLYLQDEKHGAYFAYEVLMEEEESKKLVPGTKIRISGVKAEWSGEVEIIDAKYEILEGSFIAEPEDVTALLGTDELVKHINEKIALKDLKVAASKVEGKEEEFAFLYSWDGSGSHEGNSDLYFNVEVNGQTYTLTVESYLCGNDTDVYKAVEGLKVGDTIDAEGFLYWYNGANPHITGVTVKAEEAAAEEIVAEAAEEAVEKAAEEVTEKAEEVAAAAEEAVAEVTEKAEEAAAAVEETAAEAAEEAKVMSYEDFVNAELDTDVCVEAYVQASQAWWAKDGVGRMTLYLQDEKHGAYFAYEVLMEEEESKKLVPGTKIRISGVKAEWSGEVEIIDAKYEILEGSFIAEPEDVTALLGTDELVKHINEKIALKDLKVAASKVEGKEEEFAFLYSWDGSGSHEGNSDLYFNVEVNGQTYTLTVESYLCGNDTDVYKAVEGLKVGDTIDAEGFLYWYNGANPHITGVTVK